MPTYPSDYDIGEFIGYYNESRLHFALDIDNVETPLMRFRAKKQMQRLEKILIGPSSILMSRNSFHIKQCGEIRYLLISKILNKDEFKVDSTHDYGIRQLCVKDEKINRVLFITVISLHAVTFDAIKS